MSAVDSRLHGNDRLASHRNDEFTNSGCTLMVVFPNWGITRRVMGSFLPFVGLAGVYLYLFINSLDPETAQSFSNPQLADIARLFGEEKVAATRWIHFLVMDLFVGRWIYWEGQRTGIWTIHSLIFCLFAIPLGLLVHLLTQWSTQRFFYASHESLVGSQSDETIACSSSTPDVS